MSRGELARRVDRAFGPYYLVFVVFGVVCFIVSVTANEGAHRLRALVWVFLVPLWLAGYRRYRKDRKSAG